MMGGAEIRFSWREMQEAPVYVRRFCWDLLMIKRRIMNERAPQPNSGGGR
jgi:hypothetical protein